MSALDGPVDSANADADSSTDRLELRVPKSLSSSSLRNREFHSYASYCLGLGTQCERGDSNPHGLLHWILSPARLPIPPLPLALQKIREECVRTSPQLFTPQLVSSQQCVGPATSVLQRKSPRQCRRGLSSRTESTLICRLEC